MHLKSAVDSHSDDELLSIKTTPSPRRDRAHLRCSPRRATWWTSPATSICHRTTMLHQMSIQLVCPVQVDHHLSVRIHRHTSRSHRTIGQSFNTIPHQLSFQLAARLPWIAQTSSTAQPQAWYRRLQFHSRPSKKCSVCHWLTVATKRHKKSVNVAVIQITLIHGPSVGLVSMFPKSWTLHFRLENMKFGRNQMDMNIKNLSHSHQISSDYIYHPIEFNLWTFWIYNLMPFSIHHQKSIFEPLHSPLEFMSRERWNSLHFS